MPTNNPKISLYVPQIIYDRFKQFQQERNLSMSHAGIAILAEYFGLQEETKKVAVGGVTLEALEEIRQELKELRKEVEHLKTKSNPIRADHIQTTSKPPKQVKIQQVEQNKITSKPIEESELNPVEQDKTISKLPSQENSLQLNLLSELPLKLQAKQLAQRLTTQQQEITGKQIAAKVGSTARKKSTENFIAWTRELDPDRIAWDMIKNPDGRKNSSKYPMYYYIPYKPSREQIELLEKWLSAESVN